MSTPPAATAGKRRAPVLGVRAQALLLTVVPLVFLVILFAIGSTLQDATRRAAALSRHNGDVLAQCERVLQLIGRANRSAVLVTKSHAARDETAYRKAYAALPHELAALRAITDDDPAARALERRLAHDTDDAFAVIAEYIRDEERRDTRAVTALQNSPAVRKLGPDLQDAHDRFEGRERAIALASLARLRRSTELEGRLLLGVAGAGIVLTLVIALRYGLGMARRLRLLTENAHRIGNGERPLPIPGNDEIARLDGEYRAMAERLRREHRVATELQRAMLPEQLPQIAGLRLDSAYIPAAQGTEVGGDWFDVFALGDDAIGISVGDVAGHGLRAATVMGAMRQSIRTAARIEGAPSGVLRHVNRVLCADDASTLVTAFFGVFDRATGMLRYAIAGHPPPLVARPGSGVTALPGGGLVLGLDVRAQYENFATRLDPGCGAVFYTDGIVEVERDYFKGLRDLERAIADELAAPSLNVADGIQRRVFANAEPRDDSAVLFLGVAALGVRGRPDTTAWDFDAHDTASARRVKRALLWHLAGLLPADADLLAAELAFGELIGNVARHTPGPARIVLEREGERYLLHVEDEGPAFSVNGIAMPDVTAERGRGLFLVRTLVDDVQISRTARGNRVSVALGPPRIERRAGAERRH